MFKKLQILIVTGFVYITSLSAWANLPYHPINFPRDEAAHYENAAYPVNTMSEWWYYNGKLTSKSGRQLGYYLSYNYLKWDERGKTKIVPQFSIQITDIDNKKVYGKTFFILDNSFSISTQDLNVTFGKEISLRKNQNSFFMEGLTQTEQGPQIEYSMQLTPLREPLFVQQTGLIDMGDGTNSYYYTYTRLTTLGYIKIGNEFFEIDPVKSLSWMDHQWGDFVILPWRYQWMWASIQLENGMDILLGNILDPKTKEIIRGSANIIMPDNSRKYIFDFKNDFIYQPRESLPGQHTPLKYQLDIHSIDLHLQIDALVPGQYVNGIWEGVSEAKGTAWDSSIRGQAYTEYSVPH